jgi:hypothetical protein
VVAHSGRGWTLAPSLVALEAEANRLAPGRSQASDGSIGDQAHQARKSDHNPKSGYVDAIDLTHDPRHGFDAHGWAEVIARRGDPRLKYVISNRRIHDPRRDALGAWRPYSGTSNPHTAHIHISILPSGRSDTRPWLSGRPLPTPKPPPQPARVVPQEDDDMAKLIRSDPNQGGTGAVIAVSGVLRMAVHTTEDFARWKFIAGAETNTNPETFDFFLRNTVDAHNINLAALHAQAASKELAK